MWTGFPSETLFFERVHVLVHALDIRSNVSEPERAGPLVTGDSMSLARLSGILTMFEEVVSASPAEFLQFAANFEVGPTPFRDGFLEGLIPAGFFATVPMRKLLDWFSPDSVARRSFDRGADDHLRPN